MRASSVAPNNRLSTKISVRLYQNGWQFSCHLITGRNVKHLSLENVNLILFFTKIRVSLYQKRWQFRCHLITGDKKCLGLSPENVLPHIVLVRNFIPKWC